MKDNVSSQAKTTKAHLREMVNGLLNNKPSVFKEHFENALALKTIRLAKKEKSRMASIIFCESYISKSDVSDKEDGEETNQVTYDKMIITDKDLYNREKPHMPEWMQNASSGDGSIDPIREKDAIDLSSKFHSVEFTA